MSERSWILGRDALSCRRLRGEGDVDLMALLGRQLRERLRVHRLDGLGWRGAQQVAVALDRQFVLAQLPCLRHGLRRSCGAIVGCAEQSVQEAHGVLANRSGDDQSMAGSLKPPVSPWMPRHGWCSRHAKDFPRVARFCERRIVRHLR